MGVNAQNFIKIGQTVAEISQCNGFSKWRPFASIDFKIQFSMPNFAEMVKPSRGYSNFTSNVAAFHHLATLDLLDAYFDHPQKVLGIARIDRVVSII